MQEYKYLSKLQTLSITFILAALVMAHKIIYVFGIQFSVASLIFPNTILVANIVAIVYGYKESAAVMWETQKSQIPFTLICFIALALPSQIGTANYSAYNLVFLDLWQISIASIIGTYTGLKANIYVLSKFNFLLIYKGFWLRTLCACGVGEFVFTIIAIPLMFFNKVSFSELLSILMISLFVKFIYSSLLSYFSEIIARKLIVLENAEKNNLSIKYNSFNEYKNSSLFDGMNE